MEGVFRARPCATATDTQVPGLALATPLSTKQGRCLQEVLAQVQTCTMAHPGSSLAALTESA